MKKMMKTLVSSILVMLLLFTTVYASSSEKIEAMLNALNISVNGEEVAKSGEGFTVGSGAKVPFSINYAGTTYLPMRKVAELLNKDVEYVKETKTVNIVDKVGSELLPPMTVSSELTHDANGALALDVVAYNLENKEVKSYLLNVYCYDKDFTPVINKSKQNVVTLEGDASLEGSYSIEDMKGTEIYHIEVIQVSYTDGSSWGEVEAAGE
ncbi:hypothetical protein [Anaerotignum sp. MB30-C6]|uniref:hypothetical protein n=1 Tax=Anaerotignum sp. MB30-C6 TaxID=3070814 RepID=UPI0027DC1B0C|nr:hypothetical protein [Anaerotignum sp. MB30-C6]WMI81073.1 hypothetical protein RBQ60_14885 [Anaerotignum sp. MB30-C6]